MDPGRALLFVPGDRPDRITRALEAGADAVAVDLEDGVADARKDAARTCVAAAFGERAPATGPAVYIRINALDTAAAEADLAAVSALLGSAPPTGLIVPKTESAEQIRQLDRNLAAAESAAGAGPGGLALLPIVETARGVIAAPAVAAASVRVRTLLFGTLDLAADLGVTPTPDGRELLHARSQVVLAVRAAGLPGPLDGPYPDLDDEDGLVRSSIAARELGCTGRVVLHPRQVAPVRQAFSPSDRELEHARTVVAAHRAAQARGNGAFRLPDGTFVDRPVAARAAAMLRAAGVDAEASR